MIHSIRAQTVYTCFHFTDAENLPVVTHLNHGSVRSYLMGPGWPLTYMCVSQCDHSWWYEKQPPYGNHTIGCVPTLHSNKADYGSKCNTLTRSHIKPCSLERCAYWLLFWIKKSSGTVQTSRLTVDVKAYNIDINSSPHKKIKTDRPTRSGVLNIRITMS